MSVFSGITSPEKLGGVFGLSCYVLLSDRIKNFVSENWPNKNTPFFLAHRQDDDIVPHAFGELSSKAMKELGLENVEFNSYPYVSYIQAIRLLSPRLTNIPVTFLTLLIPPKLKTWKSSLERFFLLRPMARRPRVCDSKFPTVDIQEPGQETQSCTVPS